MTRWRKYYDLEPIRRLRNQGRELIGQLLHLTEKRDGENVSIWLDDSGVVRISSRNLEQASNDIQTRLKSTPEFSKAVELLRDEQIYGNDYILFGELLKRISPTRIEPKRKHIHWILFDIWDCQTERFLGYNIIYQKAFHHRLPIVRVVDRFIPASTDDLFEHIEQALKWCRRHRREGVVGKDYKNQVFFKEKVDLPKLPKVKKPPKVQLPEMPHDRIIRALQHAFDEVGEDNWDNKRIAMPVVAKHLTIEAREHNFAVPRNMYRIYLETPISLLKPSKSLDSNT